MLQMVKRILIFSAAIMALCGCGSLDLKGIIMPTSDGVETRFENCVKMNSDLAAGTVDAGDSYVFYVAADPHIIATHTNLDTFNDTFRNDEEAAFGVVLGDCSDIRDNLKNYIAALSYYPERHSCNHRMFHILGNHDLFFDGWGNFKEIVGPSIYWFEVNFQEGKDLYISLDTATGTLVRHGVVAVDPSVIPLGSRLYIVTNDGYVNYGYAVAEDTGGAIKGNRIDLYFDSVQQCMTFGRRECTVYILSEGK